MPSLATRTGFSLHVPRGFLEPASPRPRLPRRQPLLLEAPRPALRRVNPQGIMPKVRPSAHRIDFEQSRQPRMVRSIGALPRTAHRIRPLPPRPRTLAPWRRRHPLGRRPRWASDDPSDGTEPSHPPALPERTGPVSCSSSKSFTRTSSGAERRATTHATDAAAAAGEMGAGVGCAWPKRTRGVVRGASRWRWTVGRRAQALPLGPVTL